MLNINIYSENENVLSNKKGTLTTQSKPGFGSEVNKLGGGLKSGGRKALGNLSINQLNSRNETKISGNGKIDIQEKKTTQKPEIKIFESCAKPSILENNPINFDPAEMLCTTMVEQVDLYEQIARQMQEDEFRLSIENEFLPNPITEGTKSSQLPLIQPVQIDNDRPQSVSEAMNFDIDLDSLLDEL